MLVKSKTIIYPDTEKALSDKDYIFPSYIGLNYPELKTLQENINVAYQNSLKNGNRRLSMKLYSDLINTGIYINRFLG